MRNCASKNTDQMLRWHCFLKSFWAHFVEQLIREQLHFTHEVEGQGKKALLELQFPCWAPEAILASLIAKGATLIPLTSECQPDQTAVTLKKPELWKNSTDRQTHGSLIGRHLKMQRYLMSLPEIPPLESISPKVIMPAQQCQPW